MAETVADTKVMSVGGHRGGDVIVPRLTPANVVTAGRATLIGPASWGAATGRVGAATAAAGLFGALDVLDGRLARRYGQSSAFGALLDSATDRSFFLALFAGLALSGRLGVGLTAAVVVTVVVQAVAAALYMARGEVERPKTLLGVALGALLLVGAVDAAPGVDRSVEVAAFVVAVNGGWLYARRLWAPRRLGAARPVRLPGEGLAVVRNYRAKATRSAPVGDRVWTVPNVVTLARVVPAAAGVACILDGRFGPAAALAAVFVVLDVVDGFVARHTGSVSAVGTRLDPLVDKAAFAAFAGALTVVGELPVWALAIALVRIAVVGLAAALLVRAGCELPRNWWSLPANAATGLLVVVASPTAALVAVALNVQNGVHYASVAGERLRRPVGGAVRATGAPAGSTVRAVPFGGG